MKLRSCGGKKLQVKLGCILDKVQNYVKLWLTKTKTRCLSVWVNDSDPVPIPSRFSCCLNASSKERETLKRGATRFIYLEPGKCNSRASRQRWAFPVVSWGVYSAQSTKKKTIPKHAYVFMKNADFTTCFVRGDVCANSVRGVAREPAAAGPVLVPF